MDAQIRNFKDFLQLYNKVTEICFTRCVDNFFTRNLAGDESACVDKCVTKFARFNQKMMSVYVEVQTEINQKRMIEMEEQTKLHQQQQMQQQQQESSNTLATTEVAASSP